MSVEINKGYDYPPLSVVRSPEASPVLQMNEPGKKKRKRRTRKEQLVDPFKDWCMPEQKGGYIRGTDHEFF